MVNETVRGLLQAHPDAPRSQEGMNMGDGTTGSDALQGLVTAALVAGRPDVPNAARMEPMTRGWLAALADARHILKGLVGQRPDCVSLIEHTRGKLGEIQELLAQVARWGEGAGEAEVEGSFDLVVEAARSWDNGSWDDRPAHERLRRTFVSIEGIDGAFLRRLEALERLLHREELEEVAVARPARWGSPVGLDARSLLVVSSDGKVRARLELDDGVFESVPLPVAAIRAAWQQGAVQAEKGPSLQLVRWGEALYASWATSGMARLVRFASHGRELERVEQELSAVGYRMAPSLTSLDSEDDGDAIETADGEPVDDEAALPQRVLELAAEWTQLHQAAAAEAAEFERVQQAIVRVRPRG